VALLGSLSVIGLLVCIVLAIVAKIKKNGKSKKWAMGILTCFILFIVAVANTPSNTASNTDAKVSSTTDSTQQETKSEDRTEKKEETAKVPETSDQPETTLSAEELEKKAHDEWVDGQFSLWDGSHTELVKLVKDNMNDPKSFEHAETKYLVISSQEQIDTLGKGEIGDLYVYMKFRGNNAFGGKVINEVEALASYKENTITILTSNE